MPKILQQVIIIGGIFRSKQSQTYMEGKDKNMPDDPVTCLSLCQDPELENSVVGEAVA